MAGGRAATRLERAPLLGGDVSAVTLREDWPLVAQFPGLADNLTVAESALAPGATVSATVLTYDERGLPASVTVDVTVASFYYGGASDGFAGFGTMCFSFTPTTTLCRPCTSHTTTNSDCNSSRNGSVRMPRNLHRD